MRSAMDSTIWRVALLNSLAVVSSAGWVVNSPLE